MVGPTCWTPPPAPVYNDCPWSVTGGVHVQRESLVKGLKIAFIVAALAAAAGITFLWGEDSGAVALVQGMKSAWKCAACGHPFELTPLQEGAAVELSRGEPIHCPECSKTTAWRLMACMRCGTLFFPPDVPEQSGQCPKCPPELQPPAEERSGEPNRDPIEIEAPKQRERPKSV